MPIINRKNSHIDKNTYFENVEKLAQIESKFVDLVSKDQVTSDLAIDLLSQIDLIWYQVFRFADQNPELSDLNKNFAAIINNLAEKIKAYIKPLNTEETNRYNAQLKELINEFLVQKNNQTEEKNEQELDTIREKLEQIAKISIYSKNASDLNSIKSKLQILTNIL